MSNRVVYFNGRIVPESEARVSIYDSALLLGDMAFEVTRTIHGRPFRLVEHLRRLWSSMAALSIDPRIGPDELEAITLDVLARNAVTESPDVDWNLVHDVSRGPSAAFRGAFAPDELRPTVVVACYPLVEKMAALAPAYSSGIDLVVPEQRSLPHTLFSAAIKCRSRAHYQLANLQAEARRPGSTAVLVDPDGFITEGTSGNVFFVRDGEIFTPTVRNILPGITRDLVLELAVRGGIGVHEADLSRADVERADEAFVTSTSIGILHARSWEGRPFGGGFAGPVTRRLREALYAEVGLDFAVQAASYADRLRKP
jgi:branched-chain amino acid aminotransferase